MRLPGGLDGGEPGKAPNAVVGMDHEIADGEARHFGEHVAAGLGPRAAHQPVAENVLLADDGEVSCLEAGLERQHGEGGGRLRRRQHLLPRVDTKCLGDAVLGEKGGEPLLGAFAPAGDEHALAFALQARGVSDHGVEHIAAFALPLGGEGPPLSPAEGHHIGIARGVWMLEGIEHDGLPPAQRRLPIGLGEEQALRRHGIVGRRAEGLALKRLLARFVMVVDLLQALGAGVVVERIEGDHGVRQIVEQGLQALMEQRQPMLHALMLAAGRDQLIERIVAPHRAEQLHIAGAESPARLLGQRRFAHGEQRDGIEAGERALGLGIEGADRLQRIAEEIEADGTGARRIEVEDAAAHRILAGVGHGAGAAIADMLKPLDQIRHADRVARRERLHRGGKEIVARHALQHGVDRGEHDQRRLVGAAAMFGKLGECRDAAGDDFGIWRHPVVRNAVPGWEAQALHVGGEELQRVFQRREPLAVAGDMQDRLAGLARPRGGGQARRAPRHRALRARRWRSPRRG